MPWATGKLRECPGQARQVGSGGVPWDPRAPGPGSWLLSPHRTRCHGGISFPATKGSVQRLEQPGFSQLLSTCRIRQKLPFILNHPPPPRAGKHQQKAGCPAPLLSPSLASPRLSLAPSWSQAPAVPVPPVVVSSGCMHLYLGR